LKFDQDTLASKPATFGSDTVSELVWFLIKNNLLLLHPWGPKPGSGYEPSLVYGPIRADKVSNYRSIVALGKLLAQQINVIEQDLNLKIDTILTASYSGISGATGILHAMSLQDRYLDYAIERRFKIEDISIHPFKRATHVGEIVGNVLVYDEQANTGDTILRLSRLAVKEGARPVAGLTIADRVCPFLPQGVRVRQYVENHLPLYNLINQEEITRWCLDNPEIYNDFKNSDWDKVNHRKAAIEQLKSDTQWV
jgi:orotate phosphoribosyltransferase